MHGNAIILGFKERRVGFGGNIVSSVWTSAAEVQSMVRDAFLN